MIMKVLVFSSLYPNNIRPHHGVFIQERITAFAKHSGNEVKVVAPVPYYPPIKLGSRWPFSQVAWHEVRNGLDVYHPRYPMTPKIGMVSYGILMYLSVLKTITRLWKTFDFDAIDSHFVYPDGFAGVLLGRHFRKPVVVSARGSDINQYKKLPLIRRLLQFTLRNADRVIAVSHSLKGSMIDLDVPADKIVVIPNGIDLSKFKPLPREKAKRALGLPDERVILSVGNLNQNKGFDLLIRAMRILADHPGTGRTTLTIIGDGPAHKPLSHLAASLKLHDRVRLVGSVSHDALYLWYSAADVFCLASGREGLPNVILESLACGTPVVATAVGGIPEIITSDTVGFLTERDELSLAETITRALNRSWDREKLVRHVQERTWDRVAEAVHGVLQTVCTAELTPNPVDAHTRITVQNSRPRR